MRPKKGRTLRPPRRIWLAPAILVAAWAVAWLDPETGIRNWMSLRDDLEAARGRIAVLEASVLRQTREAERLEGDPLAIEAAIREDLGLARVGESIVILREGAAEDVQVTP